MRFLQVPISEPLLPGWLGLVFLAATLVAIFWIAVKSETAGQRDEKKEQKDDPS